MNDGSVKVRSYCLTMDGYADFANFPINTVHCLIH